MTCIAGCASLSFLLFIQSLKNIQKIKRAYIDIFKKILYTIGNKATDFVLYKLFLIGELQNTVLYREEIFVLQFFLQLKGGNTHDV